MLRISDKDKHLFAAEAHGIDGADNFYLPVFFIPSGARGHDCTAYHRPPALSGRGKLDRRASATSKPLLSHYSSCGNQTPMERTKGKGTIRRAMVWASLSCLFLIPPPAHGQEGVLEKNKDLGVREKEATFFKVSDRIDRAGKFRVIASPIRTADAYSFLQKKRYEWVDLGNHGTAVRPLFVEAPREMGAKSGFRAYEAYYPAEADRDYYHFTSSFPFIRARADLGESRRSIVTIDYAKNIRPEWNLGFHLNTIQRNHLLGAVYQASERNVHTLSYGLQASYLSHDKKYEMVSQVSGRSHKVGETGGSQSDEGEVLVPNYYLYRRARVHLKDAFSLEKRNTWRTWHQFHLSPTRSVYLSLKKEREVQQYRDALQEEEVLSYYGHTYFSAETTDDETRFHTHCHQIGFVEKKGHLFYEIYGKQRVISYRGNRPTNEKRGAFVEKYLGMRGHFLGEGDQGLFTRLALMMNEKRRFLYLLQGELRGARGVVDLRYVKKNPDLVTRYYYGNHHQWTEHFLPTRHMSLGIKTYLTKETERQIALIARWMGVQNLIYYNREALPAQWRPSYLPWVLRGSLSWRWQFLNYFYWEAKGIYNYAHRETAKYLPAPTLFFYTRLSYERLFFNEYLHLVWGAEAHRRSTYHGYAYQPATRQFHLQDTLLLPGYAPINLFLNAKIETFTAYIKVIHVNQRRNGGYLTAPYYPGERRFIDMGFVWHFFN